MRALRISGIKAFSNIKQKRGQQSKEDGGGDDFTGLFAVLSLSISGSLSFVSILRLSNRKQECNGLKDNQWTKRGAGERKGSRWGESEERKLTERGLAT